MIHEQYERRPLSRSRGPHGVGMPNIGTRAHQGRGRFGARSSAWAPSTVQGLDARIRMGGACILRLNPEWQGSSESSGEVRIANLEDWAGGDFVIAAEEVKAARSILGWTQAHLAEQAGIAVRTVVALETKRAVTTPETLERIEAVFAAAGVVFRESKRPGWRSMDYKSALVR